MSPSDLLGTGRAQTTSEFRQVLSQCDAPHAVYGYDYGECSVADAREAAYFFRRHPHPTPWFDDWCERDFQATPAAPHTTLHHPVACLLVVAPESDVPVADQAAALWGRAARPDVLRRLPFVSADIQRFALVLCSGLAGRVRSDAELAPMLAALQQMFGRAACTCVRLAGVLAPPDVAAPAPWPQAPFAAAARSVSLQHIKPLAAVKPIGSQRAVAVALEASPLGSSPAPALHRTVSSVSPATLAAAAATTASSGTSATTTITGMSETVTSPLTTATTTATATTTEGGTANAGAAGAAGGESAETRVLIKPLPECDVAALTEMAYTFLGGPVYRTLAETTAYLRQCAQAQRRGLTSRMKSLFRAPQTSTPPAALPPPQYAACDTPLAGARKLADLLALQGDFVGALAAYQQCAAEVRAEKLALAFNHEMQGALALLTDGGASGTGTGNTGSTAGTAPGTRAAESAFDAAYALYHTAGERHHAVRCSYLAAAHCLAHGDGARAHDWLARAASLPRTPALTHTLLTEQAAFALLRTPAPRFRKICATLVLVAHEYDQGAQGDNSNNAISSNSSMSNSSMSNSNINVLSQQQQLGHHAYRCLRLAYPLYADRGWAAVEDLLRLALVRHAFALGRYDECETHLRRLVAHNVQPAAVHSTLLRQLLCICERRAAERRAAAAAVAPPELPFPVQQPQSFRMRLNDDPPDCAGADACALRDVRWNVVSRTRRVAYVGETVTVEVDVTNPLLVAIQFAQMHAVCDFQPDTSSSTNNAQKQQQQQEEQEQEQKQEEKDSDADEATTTTRKLVPFTAQLTDVVLEPGETKRLSLAVALGMVGTVRVCGFAFDVFNRVWGMRRFSFLPPPASPTPGTRGARSAVDPDVLIVAPAMPRLQIAYGAFPAAVHEGAVVPVVLRIRNTSTAAAATRIRLAFSQPSLLVFDAARCTLPGVAAAPESPLLDSDHALLASMADDAFATLAWTDITGLVVAPSSTVELPFLFRAHNSSITTATTTTSYLLHTAMAYSTCDAGSRAVRFAHAHTRVAVRAAVRVHTQVLPNPAAADALLLRVRVDNLLRDHTLALAQLACVSRRWRIAPAAPAALARGLVVRPGESVSHVFHLRVEPPDTETETDATGAEPESFLRACRTTVCTDGRAPVDVLHGTALQLVEAEAFARWEAGEFGPAPRTKNNTRRADDGDGDDGDDGDVSAFGLSSIAALPSFANAYMRAEDTAQPTTLPDLDVLTVHWALSPSSASSSSLVVSPDGAESTVHGLTASMQPASASVPGSACMQHQCPVRLTVTAPPRAKHDFAAEPLCIVPVTITARNYSTSRSLHVSFDAVVPNNPTHEWFAYSPSLCLLV